MKQRLYIDGQLTKTSRVTDPAKVRQWLDNVERDWLKHGLFPLTPAGAFDLNQAHTVERTSPDELIVVTTKGRRLRFVNVEAK